MKGFLDVYDFLCAYSMWHAMIPGKIETFSVIIDLKDVSLHEFPFSDL